MDVFNQRLEQEYGAEVVLTAPNVPIKVKVKGAKNIKAYGGDVIAINNPCNLPDTPIIEEMYEPFVLGTIITPGMYIIYTMGLQYLWMDTDTFFFTLRRCIPWGYYIIMHGQTGSSTGF